MPNHKKDYPILIIGGHATPAEAVCEQLIKRLQPIVWVGPSQINRDGSTGREAHICQQLSIPYVSIALPKWDRTNLLTWLGLLIKVPRSLLICYRYLRMIQPRMILGFGGYVSLPFNLVARLLGIPVIIHEQTTIMGTANRVSQLFSDTTLISWPKTLAASKKAILVGNPVRMTVADSKPQPRRNQLLVCGGNQGSQAINQAVWDQLTPLLNIFETIIHQTGELHLKTALQIKASLPKSVQSRYHPVGYLSADKFVYTMTTSKMVLSRSGANTVTELLVTKTPSILVPLPHAAFGEQYQNAKLLVELGLAQILAQVHLSHLTSSLKAFSLKPNHRQIDKLTTLTLKAATTVADYVK